MMLNAQLLECRGMLYAYTYKHFCFFFSLGLPILLQNTYNLSLLSLHTKVITETYTGTGMEKTYKAEHNAREKDAKTQNSKTGPCCPYTPWDEQG